MLLSSSSHFGPHAEGYGRGVHARHPGAQHDDLGRVRPWHASHQHAAAAAGAHAGDAHRPAVPCRPATSDIGASSGRDAIG